MPDNGFGQLEKLTRGEHLLIAWRRSGESQRVWANRMGASLNAYGQMERDTRLSSGKGRVKKLLAQERCFLYRRRAKKTQEEVAQDLGCSRFWLNQMERGVVPCDDLLWYWEQ